MPNRDRVEHYELVVEHPASAKVDFEFFFPRQALKPTIVPSATQTKLVFADLPQQPELEAFAFNNVHAYVWPQVREGGQPAHAPHRRAVQRLLQESVQ